MTAAFGNRPKERLNQAMDALNFEYPDYDRLDEGAGGAKRKRVVSILSRQAAWSVKEDEEALKNMKTVSEPKALTLKKRKLAEESLEETKTKYVLKPIAIPSSSADEVSEILKVMIESFPFTPLSPHGLELTSLLQKKEVSLAAEGRDGGQKRRRIVNILQATEQTAPPPSASASKAAKSTDAEATATPEGEKLATTLSEIDKLISDVVVEKEVVATILGKGKEIYETSSKGMDFDLRHLGSQQLSEEDRSKLREFAISCGYQPGSVLFGGVDEEILGCIRDRAGAKIIGTLSKSVGFPKLETDISGYRRQHIIGIMFYSNFKVRTLLQVITDVFVLA
jgi:hypothetical protein